ncbi:MAG: DUF1080 domain-containing protein [Planctomycetota bacterium]|nr:DUF1080 domain-containing protein [Planctomycetota bacterium]
MSTLRSLLLLTLSIGLSCSPGCDTRDRNRPTSVTPSEETVVPEAPTAADEVPPIVTDNVPQPPAPAPLPISEIDLSDGWIRLFDGQTLFGWQAANEANWAVEDGAITVSQGDVGLLHTTSQFTDYVLQLEFNAAAETNSGIFLRTAGTPSDPASDCYELNIAPADNPFPTGSLVGRKRVEGNLNSSGWQTMQVTVVGDQISILLDGNQVMDYQDPQPLGRGHIGLQLNSGAIAFRNILIKPLALTTIFNGKDLTGWVEYPEMESQFTVTEQGELNVKNGKGQLETTGQYANFILQLECISYQESLNSGIFFRCIPGDEMMGYESQIQNGMKNGDPTLPEDCGTGGIFRRQDARRIIAQDKQWFHKTIIASENQFSVWVNGYQVTDWTDTRKSDVNPRRGLRMEAGTIMIQGHDPTTNLSFRNLRISEL